MNLLPARDRRIPRRSMLWLAAALLFTLPPMFGTLALWVPLLFAATLATKFWMEPRGYRCRSVVLKLVLAAAILAAIALSYGSLQGIEPGVSLVVGLMSLKVLEAHTAREFQVMALIGFVVCLCGFFLSQDLGIALCLLIAFALLLVSLVQFHGQFSGRKMWAPVAATFRLLAQAAPLTILLFLFFPRLPAGIRFQFGTPRGNGAGFSDRLEPGSVALLASSSAVAFRAEFPDGNAPPPAGLYWRGTVMWQGGGLEWNAPAAPAALPRAGRSAPNDRPVRQWITIEPHNNHWVFALDWPAEPPSGVLLAPGNYLWSGQTIRKSRRFEVKSFPGIREKELRPREQRMLLEIKGSISARAWQLVQSWTRDNAPPRAVVKSALQFFRTQGFRYTLTPGEYPTNDLDEFLFQRRLGFCEHYAASFASLMRMAGIPARVVTGYLGGEYNEMGQFYVVRQSDAHAWCEVWFAESGWERIDPTSVVAPDRLNLGLDGFLENRAAQSQAANVPSTFARGLRRSPFFTKIRLGWQTLSYTWDTRVLSFDDDTQDSLFSSIKLPARGPLTVLVMIAGTAASLLAGYFLWARWRNRPARDPIKALYEKFCARAARLGAPREPTEGPLDFCRRAGRLLPNEHQRIERIVAAYISLRYANDPSRDLLDEFARETEQFARTAR